MADIIRIKKGLDIPLDGIADPRITQDTLSKQFAIVPDDFPGIKFRLKVKHGDTVHVGTVLLADKENEMICLVSPVNGVVSEIRRGERRKILAVVIDCDKVQNGIAENVNLDFSSPQSSIHSLCQSGLWAWMHQRPYDIVPKPQADFRDVFVTAFDSAPLAPQILMEEHVDDLEKGLEILSKLTTGNVYLSVPFGSGITSKVAKVNEFQGPHPSGNVGTQIEAIRPVNKGERILTLDARTAARIGALAGRATLDFSTIVAITGPGAINPHCVKTVIGASIKSLLHGFCGNEQCLNRIISGNVLTGYKVDIDSGFLRFPYRQVTILPEGNNADEFMGWASLSPKKFSVKRSFPAFLKGGKGHFNFDARLLGGHRAMILSGEYDKVFPFDIYPEYLLKAIIAKDIDKMEKLGIYEVAPEDFALPEFVDTSKLPLQQIVQDGLDYLRCETE